MAISSGRPRVWREEEGLSALPKAWSIYRIVEFSGEIFYIGITSNLYARLSWHRNHPDGKFFSGRHELNYQLASQGVHWDDMCGWEQRKIGQHQPVGVTYIGGNGRRPAVEINGQVVQAGNNETIEDAAERAGLLGQFIDLFRR